jgi:hypothetical protein
VEVEDAPDNVDQLPCEHRGRLPFDDAVFLFVTNRHESFVASEVARVSQPAFRLAADGAV